MDTLEKWAEEVSVGLAALGIVAAFLTWSRVAEASEAGYSSGLGIVALICAIAVFCLALALEFDAIDSITGWRIATVFAAVMLAVALIDGIRIWDDGPGDATSRPGVGLWLTVIAGSALVGLAITLTWDFYFDDDDEPSLG